MAESIKINRVISNIALLCNRFFDTKDSGFMSSQRSTVYYYLLLILCIGIPVKLMGAGEKLSAVSWTLNALLLLITIIVGVLYRFRKLFLNEAVVILILSIQAELCAEMLVSDIYQTEYNRMIILGNVVLLAFTAMLSLIAYMPLLSYVLCAITLVTYLVCMELTQNAALKNFFPLFTLFFLSVCVLGSRLLYNFRRLEAENRLLKDEDKELLNVLHMNKQQIIAYVQLAQQHERSYDRIRELLETIGHEKQRNLIDTVSTYLAGQRTGMEQLEEVFHELTVSELEICKLILDGKKLKEICSLLGKTEGNITSQRAHIRAKLGMKPEENLKKRLEERLRRASCAPK